MLDNHVTKPQKPALALATVAVSLSAFLAGAPVSSADPYDDDDGGSSYSTDGGMDEPGGGMVEEPAGGGMDESPAGGGMDEEPAGGGMVEEPAGGGMDQSPAGGGMVEEPAGGGMDQSPAGGGMVEEPAGGGMDESPAGGGMVEEPAGGGMDQSPAGGGMDQSPAGGGMDQSPAGGGMDQSPAGGGMDQSPAGGGMLQSTESQAPQQDLSQAKASEVVTASSAVASSEQISSYRESIESTLSTSSVTTTSGSTFTLTSPISRWNSGWISYDSFYRPVFVNPYRAPLDVVYDYGGKSQVFTIGPLQRAGLEVPNQGTYSFTALTRPASGPASNLAVGSFSGGGYQPAPGQPAPTKPPKLNTVKNPLVQVKYDQGSSDPFRMKSLVDLGKDPSRGEATKVLLDGEIPAWGEWTKSPQGEPLFVIAATQQLPGVNPPGQDPIPGYTVKLTASAAKESWLARNKTTAIAVGAGLLVLAAATVIGMRRRRVAE